MSETYESPDDLIRLGKAAREVTADGVHPSTIYRWVQQGRLRAWKVGGHLHVSRQDLRRVAQPVAPEYQPAPRMPMKRETERILRRAGILK